MFPELRFAVGQTHVLVSMHAVAILLGVAGGAVVALRRARVPEAVPMVVTLVAIAALGGAHGLFRLLHGGEGSGGLASIGGIAAGLAATVVAARLTRQSPLALLDAIAPAGLVALGVGRLGCFLAGCCYGGPTDLPWGVLFPGLGPPPRHPLQLYAALGDLTLVGLLPARAPSGVVGCRTCVVFGLLRVVLETLRDPATTDVLVAGVTVPQAFALLLVIAGALGERGLRARDPSTMPPLRRSFAFETASPEAVDAGNASQDLRDEWHIEWKRPDQPAPDPDLTPRKQ